MKTLEEIKQDPWFKSRPKAIQQAIINWPPNQFYRLKETGQKVRIYAMEEQPKGKCTTCKIIAQSPFSPALDHAVFGVKLTSLEPWTTDPAAGSEK